jgi:hypothetical protein
VLSMSHHGIVQSRDEPNTALGAQTVACPKCSARFVFCRGHRPFIDACGFESYTLECNDCGASLAGIVDPFDDTLLISEMAT